MTAGGKAWRGRLPRGRHGLPREIVTRSQRERLLAGVVGATATKGYAAATIADILERAGVGRETFYELFKDKRDCMLAAHRLLFDRLDATVREAYLADAWPRRVRLGVTAALDWFASDPPATRFMLVELAAVGPVSRERFGAEFGRFSDLFREGIPAAAATAAPAQASRLAVGAAIARVYEEVVKERTAELPALVPDLTYEILVPFLGEGAADEERRAAREAARSAPRAGR